MAPVPVAFASTVRRFGRSTTAADVLTRANADLTGRTIAITGSTSGIGTECARLFAVHKAHVVCLVRNVKLAEEQREEWIKQTPEAKVDIVECNLDSLASVRDAAQKYIGRKWPLHVLLLNAGVAAPLDGESADALDRTFSANHLGHFYLTRLLLDTMKGTADENDDKRIVVVSSEAHRRASIKSGMPVDELSESLVATPRTSPAFWHSMRNYCDSKLYNVWFANHLAKRLAGDKIAVSSLHPGIIETGLSRHSYSRWGWKAKLLMAFSKPLQKTIAQGAATNVFCAVAPDIKGMSGYYYDDCWVRACSDAAQRDDLADKLWTISDALIDKFEGGQLTGAQRVAEATTV